MLHIEKKHIKKYATLGSIILFPVLFLHLLGTYIYMGGHYVGLPGGSTSIALVGEPIRLDAPLSYGSNPADEIVYPFVYRGLIRFNPDDSIAQEDLAQCDISNIEKITCTLKKDIQWSDGTSIKEDDVIATYRAFAQSGENIPMKEVLRDTRLEAKNGTITFSNPDRDPNILKMLTYPIFRSDLVEQMRTGRFGSGSHVTSGQYTVLEQVEDPAYINTRLTLVRNPNTHIQESWFDRIHFKFFESSAAIKNAESTVGVVLPTGRNTQIKLSERFRPYNYTTHEYFSLFFHTDRLSKSLRNILHWQIGTSLTGTLEDNHRGVSNLFSSRPTLLPRGDIGNFVDIMKRAGYMKRDEWIYTIESAPTTLTGNIVYDAPRFFSNRQNSNILFVTEASGGILLSGRFDTNVTSVIINGYELKEFRPGNKVFNYRVSIENGTLAEGKNTYLLEGKIGDTDTSTGEILTLYYTKDADKMNEYKSEVDREYIARNNTPALIAEREREKQIQKEKAMELDPMYYFNKEGKAFTITLAYVTGPQSTEKYALQIERILKRLSIKTELVPLEPKALQEIITTGKKEYDILVAGISAGDTLGDIGQLFDPREAGKGVNFSNIEIPKLYTLFSEYRSATIRENQDKIIDEIIRMMESESFFFPISSPIQSIYIDRNLKGIRDIPVLSGYKSIYEILEYASIKDEYIFNMQGKSVGGFFGWISGLLF